MTLPKCWTQKVIGRHDSSASLSTYAGRSTVWTEMRVHMAFLRPITVFCSRVYQQRHMITCLMKLAFG